MHGNDCSETWKMKLVRAQIDHRSLFLLKTQWQQSRDVLFHHSVLQHPRESVDHSGHHHRSCGMCCASYPFWGHHLTVNSHPTKTNSAQLLLPLDTCSFSNQRLSCSTVHYQVSRGDFRGSSCPCRILVVLATPGSRIPDRLLTDSVQKCQSRKDSRSSSILVVLFLWAFSLPVTLLLAAKASVFLAQSSTKIFRCSVSVHGI